MTSLLRYKARVALLAASALAACGPLAEVSRSWTTASTENVPIAEGPPIEDVVTAFDEALSCLRGKIRPEVIFAVGQVIDHTGKENYSEGGSGKFVSQGAGEMVQSALYRAGVSIVNRRDPNIAIVESNWGIRDIKRQVPVNFYISGSINSLDFIPGGGAEISVAGIGPRYRQNRILIGLDLTMTDAYTGRVVGSVPLQKQIFAREVGFSAGRFFGETLVTMDAGGMEREAVHFALRQMLSLATFELLGQIMSPKVYDPCREKVNTFAGSISHSGTGDRNAMAAAVQAARDAQAEALLVAVQNPEPQAPAPAQAPPPAVQQPASAPKDPAAAAAQELHRTAIAAAVRSISLAKESEGAATQKQAVQQSAESLRLANMSLVALKRAADSGLSGDQGDAAAVVVQQAVEAARKAALAATTRKPDDPAEAGDTAEGDKPTAAAEEAPSDVQLTGSAPADGPETKADAEPKPPVMPGTPGHLRKFGQ